MDTNEKFLNVSEKHISHIGGMSSRIKVGFFAFPGKKFSPDPYVNPQCLGVVGWVNSKRNAPVGKRGLIVTKSQILISWADRYSLAMVGDRNDGQENTQNLLKVGQKNEQSFPAAEWCFRYHEGDFIKQGEGFLPAINQLECVLINLRKVNSALQMIGGDPLSDWIWSSTESTMGRVWVANGDYVGVANTQKNFYSRCFLAF